MVIVCGRNQALKSFLSKIFDANENVVVLGYIDHMDDLMANASCIVTKPGGLTLSEAIIAELPIIVYRPVPGQERNNARYLESKKAAVVCRTSDGLLRAVTELLNASERRREMKKALRALGKRGASDRIALDIVRQLNIMEEASSASALLRI
jgi:processive 1,2-diacylglycerol beta-glucosyltransferase